MDMIRITARWTGFPGGPGYSNFFFAGGGGLISDVGQVADRVMSAFSEITTWLASGTRIELEPEAAIVDSDTGVVSDFAQVDSDTAVVAGGNANYAGPTGAVVNWRTNDLRNGRRIRGRTFLVPLNSSSFEGNGTLLAAARDDLQDFADIMMSGPGGADFGVWSRPRNGAGGVFATVTSASVPDMAAVLRSRRD